MTTSRPFRAALVAVVVAAVAGACGGAEEEIAGRLRISGSTTLLPMVSAVAGTFAAGHPLVEMDVRMTGTGDGFALFCDGMVDLAGASRDMSARERDTCAEAGVQFLRLTVARDAVVLMTPAELGAPACLARDQIYALLGPESAGVDQWPQASEVVAGAGDGLPRQPLVAVGPGASSGTKQLLVDLAIAPLAEERGRRAALRGDYVAESSEQLIVNRLGQTATGLGFAGLATASQWGDRVRLVEADFGAGCVAPSVEAIRSGEYPLSRPLYLYVDVQAARSDPALRGFVDAIVADEGLAVAGEVGGVPLSDEEAADQRAAWARAVDGEDGA